MDRSRISPLATLLLPAVAAEVGVRLLSPRPRPTRPDPAGAERSFKPEEIERGAKFARPQLLLGLLSEAIRLGTLAFLTRQSRRAPRLEETPPLVAGALGGAKLAGALLAAPLPVSVIARRRSLAVGLSTQSWSGWLVDLVKSGLIGTTLAAAAGSAALSAIRRWPRGWWVSAAAGSVAFAGLSGVLAPVVLDPLFNDFEPLPEGETRSAVLELASRAGVEVGEVYTVDASRRTTGANAYVGGLGPTKRVVLTDTLLSKFGPDEIRVVVAHELSHVRHRDVMRFLAFSAIVAPASALAVQQISRMLAPNARGAQVIPPLALATALVVPWPGILANRLSRAIERRADAESLERSDDPDAFIALHRRIALQNLADVEPPRWVGLLLASHPPTMERIGAAVAYAARRQPA